MIEIGTLQEKVKVIVGKKIVGITVKQEKRSQKIIFKFNDGSTTILNSCDHDDWLSGFDCINMKGAK